MTAPARNAQGMMFTKTETEYNMKSIRFLLLTITAMFVVIGIMMIVLGISVYGHYHSFSFFYDSVKSGRFMTPSVMCVFIGFVLLVVSTFGFMGSLKLSTCMVNFYALILLKILIVKLAIVILAFTTGSSALMGYIDIPVAQYPVDREIQTEIDALQAGIGCCGSNSFLDYIGMEFTDSHNTSVVTTEVDGDIVSMVVPRTCCAGNSQAICNRLRATGCKQAIANAISQNAAVLGVLGLSVMFILASTSTTEMDGDIVSMVVPRTCCAGNSQAICNRLRATGCKQAIANAISQNAAVLGVLGLSVMFILVLGITFALLLARCIRKLKSERAMMAWKIREQLIIARMEEERKNDPTLYIAPAESSVA